MKKILVVLSIGLVSCSVFGQGGVVMNTRATGVSAPVTNKVTGLPISGPGYSAQLYYGLPGGAEDAMRAVLGAPGGTEAPLATFATGTSAGFITTGSGGGNRYVDTAVVAAGAPTAFQLRAWETALGNNWNTAYAAWSGGPVGPVLGTSKIIQVATSPTSTTSPSFMTPMTGFYVDVVPEPGVLALGAIGLVAVLWRRRK